MLPPHCWVMLKTVERPSPVPSPGPFVVKKRLEDSAPASILSIPMPVSVTASITCAPALEPTCSRVVGVEIDVPRLERERSPRRHRVAGVHDQVHDHLLDVRRVRADSPERLRFHHLELDVLAQESPQHLVHASQEIVQIDHPRRDHLLAAEEEELAGEVCGADGRLAGFRRGRCGSGRPTPLWSRGASCS